MPAPAPQPLIPASSKVLFDSSSELSISDLVGRKGLYTYRFREEMVQIHGVTLH